MLRTQYLNPNLNFILIKLLFFFSLNPMQADLKSNPSQSLESEPDKIKLLNPKTLLIFQSPSTLSENFYFFSKFICLSFSLFCLLHFISLASHFLFQFFLP